MGACAASFLLILPESFTNVTESTSASSEGRGPTKGDVSFAARSGPSILQGKALTIFIRTQLVSLGRIAGIVRAKYQVTSLNGDKPGPGGDEVGGSYSKLRIASKQKVEAK